MQPCRNLTILYPSAWPTRLVLLWTKTYTAGFLLLRASLISTSKRLGIDPFAYREVSARLHDPT